MGVQLVTAWTFPDRRAEEEFNADRTPSRDGKSLWRRQRPLATAKASGDRGLQETRLLRGYRRATTAEGQSILEQNLSPTSGH